MIIKVVRKPNSRLGVPGQEQQFKSLEVATQFAAQLNKDDPSVKSNSECNGSVIRKLNEEEKAFLKKVYSSDLEFED